LFKVRNQNKTIYCFSDDEKNEAIKKLKGPSQEITRFKGLGEISPNEFKQFIGKDIRLIPISVSLVGDIKPTLEFYMGKNTPERKQFIIENLFNEEEVLKDLARS
jgi:DNA gyrase subunit B/topoisomerase-4 subunit B